MQQISQYAAAVATNAATAATAATGQPVPPQPTPPGHSFTANSSTTTTGPNTPTTTPTAPPPPPNSSQPHARVVFTRPSFTPNIPPSAFGTRGTTINVRATMPGQQPGQVRMVFDVNSSTGFVDHVSLWSAILTELTSQCSPQAFNPAALNQMISGLVGQLLLPGQMGPSMLVFALPH